MAPNDTAPTIVFQCACTQVLEAPGDWAGRQVRCTKCRAATMVPVASDPEAVKHDAAARRREAQLHAQPPVSRRTLEPTVPEPPARPLPPPEPPASRAAFWARTITMVLVPIAVLASGYVWYKRTKPIPVDDEQAAPSAEVPRPAAEADELASAERAYDQRGQALAEAQKLAVLYRKADSVPAEPRRRAYLCNNAAWFFATTPHLSLRDPARSLALATIAVELTAGNDPNYLDTLAESLFLNGKATEAVETEKRAIALLPDAGADFLQRYAKYRSAAAKPSR